MPYFSVPATPYKQKRRGVQIKSFWGEHIQLTFIRLEPGFVSDHTHPEEQIGYLLAGEVELVIGDEQRRCMSGDGYIIPGGMRHSFRVVSAQPVELVEVFSPPKEENK